MTEMKEISRNKLLGAPALLLIVAALALAKSQHLDEGKSSPMDFNEPTDYFRDDSLHQLYSGRISFDDYVTYSMQSLKQVAGFDNDLHRYDSNEDLINSFERNLTYSDDLGHLRARIDTSEADLLEDQSELTLIENELNQANCASQLDFIFEQSLSLFKDAQAFGSSKKLDLIDFLDSFGGSPSPQLMMGNFLWLGSFEQCRRAQVKASKTFSNGESVIRGRYCVANLASPAWAHKIGSFRQKEPKQQVGSYSIKLAVCLPRACNSISILRHANRLESLIKLVRLQQVPFSSYKLAHLFCLPDEASPLRQLSLSAKLFVGSLLVWLSLVLYFSLNYEFKRATGRPAGHLEAPNKLTNIFAFRLSVQNLFESKSQPAATGGSALALASSKQVEAPPTWRHLNLQVTAQQHGLNKDMEITLASRLPASSPGRQQLGQATKTTVASGRANLSAIDGVKVLSMIWLISAHTMLFLMRSISNGRHFWAILLDPRFMTIMAGIFPVDSFFTVTGILTTYLKFNKNHGRPMRRLKYWAEALVHRYLRFMPMYLLIFWYTRDVSEYLGTGPLWDYATASTSLRSVCKQESALVPLLFQANFKPLEQHCVKPAWYLANDYQFLLITPIFMALIMCNKWLGYLTISLSIVASVVMQFLTVFQAPDFTDYETIINFKPLFIPYVLKDLWKLYVLPYNRIAPYLIGLLTGHLMYMNQGRESRRSGAESGGSVRSNGRPDEACYQVDCDDHGGPGSVDGPSNVSSSQESIQSSSGPSETDGSAENIVRATRVSGSRDLATQRQQEQPVVDHENSSSKIGDNCKTISPWRCWSRYFGLKVLTPVALLISIIYLPLTSKLSEQRGELARWASSLALSLTRSLWSLAIARLVYVCAKPHGVTDSFIKRFLSSAKWRPWSRVGFSVLLIQWEVISYVSQTQTMVPHMTISYLLAMLLLCTLATYAISLVVYLTIEYPLAQIERLYIHPALFGGCKESSVK